MTNDTTLKNIFENSDLKITMNPADGDTLIVVFTGVGHGLGAIQREEFVSTARDGGGACLFVADKKRSWYNSPGIYEKIVATAEQVASQYGKNKIMTLGNSMGGFGAMLFAKPLNAKVALAFAPQTVVAPADAPNETRWKEFRSAVQQYRFSRIAEFVAMPTTYLVVHGRDKLEEIHIENTPKEKYVHHYVVEHTGHDVAAYIKQNNKLGEIIKAAMSGKIETFEEIMLRLK